MDKRSRLSKKPNKAYGRVLMTIVVIGIIFDLTAICLLLNPSTSEPIKYSVTAVFYDEMAKHYQTYPEIQEIANKCRQEQEKTYCVFSELPFYYDHSRKDFPLLINPEEYMILDGLGVCRDVAVIRKAIFNEMGIDSMFIFEPNHVYVVAAESDVVYELNNQFFSER